MADRGCGVSAITRHHGEFGAPHAGHCAPGVDMEAAAGGWLGCHDRFDAALVELQVHGGRSIAGAAAHALQCQHRVGLQFDHGAIGQLDADIAVGSHLQLRTFGQLAALGQARVGVRCA